MPEIFGVPWEMSLLYLVVGAVVAGVLLAQLFHDIPPDGEEWRLPFLLFTLPWPGVLVFQLGALVIARSKKVA